MENVLTLLPRLFRVAGDSDEAREHAAVAAWLAAVGPQVRKLTTALRLERKTLIVATLDETWRAQLRAMSGHALFKMNSLLGAPVVTALQFVVNEPAVRAAHSVPAEVTPCSPTNEALPLVEKAAAIPEPLLRDTFLRAAGKCLARRAS